MLRSCAFGFALAFGRRQICFCFRAPCRLSDKTYDVQNRAWASKSVEKCQYNACAGHGESATCQPPWSDEDCCFTSVCATACAEIHPPGPAPQEDARHPAPPLQAPGACAPPQPLCCDVQRRCCEMLSCSVQGCAALLSTPGVSTS